MTSSPILIKSPCLNEPRTGQLETLETTAPLDQGPNPVTLVGLALRLGRQHFALGLVRHQ